MIPKHSEKKPGLVPSLWACSESGIHLEISVAFGTQEAVFFHFHSNASGRNISADTPAKLHTSLWAPQLPSSVTHTKDQHIAHPHPATPAMCECLTAIYIHADLQAFLALFYEQGCHQTEDSERRLQRGTRFSESGSEDGTLYYRHTHTYMHTDSRTVCRQRC